MWIYRISFITMLCFVWFNNAAHLTIIGFEDTLNYEDKARLEQFIADHKKIGYQKCYYHNSEDTVVCENADQEKVYFK